MTIERDFDVPFIASLALREKQIQQNYRPIIAVHKWFARRPGTLFRGLILSEFADSPLKEAFYKPHNLRGRRIADPFMGGGTPLLEANRLGCDVLGLDINPMAYWVVRQEFARLDLEAYKSAASQVLERLRTKIGKLYLTRCPKCGEVASPVKYFLWVKQQKCVHCKSDFDLFPGYLIAENRRHPLNVILCASCGALNEKVDRNAPGTCANCEAPLVLQGPATRGLCLCPICKEPNRFPTPGAGPPRHRLFALEYHCPVCKPIHEGRFFKKPDDEDLVAYDHAAKRLGKTSASFVPDDEIPAGDETNRLHRWGYRLYREMFNDRQLLGLSLLAEEISCVPDRPVREALATNLSDLLRYQNMLCRYDSMALKSLDIFSVHGYPVGLVQCESNLLGIARGQCGMIGSGGWQNIVDKFVKAKSYCERPFEVLHESGRKRIVWMRGESIGEDQAHDSKAMSRKVTLKCQNAMDVAIPPASLDGVFTDPPYFGNVQYAELMDFCYVWLRKLIGHGEPAFKEQSTRRPQELTGNLTMDRGQEHFMEGLSAVFGRMAEALIPGAPLVFTYHHNSLEAYFPPAIAILDSGLVCSASLPCPAEMGASIHINGTGSSIVDTIFVCRRTGFVPKRWLAQNASEIASLVLENLAQLEEAQVKPTRGDTRCIIFGHLVRLAVWRMRKTWNRGEPTTAKIRRFRDAVAAVASLSQIESILAIETKGLPRKQIANARELAGPYEGETDAVPF